MRTVHSSYSQTFGVCVFFLSHFSNIILRDYYLFKALASCELWSHNVVLAPSWEDTGGRKIKETPVMISSSCSSLMIFIVENNETLHFLKAHLLRRQVFGQNFKNMQFHLLLPSFGNVFVTLTFSLCMWCGSISVSIFKKK